MNNTVLSLPERESHRLADFFPFYKKAEQVMVKNTPANHLIVPISPGGFLGLKKVWMPYYDSRSVLDGVPLLECFTMDDFSGCVIPDLEHIASVTFEESELKFQIYILTNGSTNHSNIFWMKRDQYQDILGYNAICVFSVSTIYSIIVYLEEKRQSLAMRN